MEYFWLIAAALGAAMLLLHYRDILLQFAVLPQALR